MADDIDIVKMKEYAYGMRMFRGEPMREMADKIILLVAEIERLRASEAQAHADIETLANCLRPKGVPSIHTAKGAAVGAALGRSTARRKAKEASDAG